MPSTPFMGVRISWLKFARNLLLARFAASAASLASSDGLLGEFAIGDELHRAGQSQRRAVGGAFGLAARAHPFVVSGLVPDTKFQVRGRRDSRGDRRALRVTRSRSSGWIKVCEVFARGAQFLDAVAQTFRRSAVRTRTRLVMQIDFPQPSCVPRRARSSRISTESNAALVRFKSLMSTVAPVMRSTSPDGPCVTLRFFADPALAAAVEQHPIFAAVSKDRGRGFEAARCARGRSHPDEPGTSERFRSSSGVAGGHAQQLAEIVGADAAVARENRNRRWRRRPRSGRCSATRWHSAAGLPAPCAR